MRLILFAIAMLLSLGCVAQTADELQAQSDAKRVIEKLDLVNGASADDLAWLKITFSTDKSGENRVGSEALDSAVVTLTPDDPEFADVLKAVKAAAARKTANR